MPQSNTWTVTLEQDGDDLILPLPQDILDALDIKEGDVLEWLDNGNGTWALKKVDPWTNVDSGLTENLV